MSYPFKHASFDVWNTLITPNPEYAAARNALLAYSFAISSEQAKFTYTHVKKFADGLSEMNGMQTPSDDLYELLCKHIRINAPTAVSLNLRDDFHKLFAEHPPTFDPNLVDALKQLHADGVTISLGSNTNFIAGRIMREVVFKELDIPFSFMMFSDEEWYAKPHPNFFGVMLEKVEELHPTINSKQIAHIGDSQRADVYGATNARMQGLLVDSPADTLDLLISLKAQHA